MPRPSRLTEDQLRTYLAQGLTQQQIADAVGITRSAVGQKIARLEVPAEAKAPARAARAHANLWEVRQAGEYNYGLLMDLLDQTVELDARLRILAEGRKYLEFSLRAASLLYSTAETQAFMEEVMRVIDDCEPGSKEIILRRLGERRSLRAAFQPG